MHIQDAIRAQRRVFKEEQVGWVGVCDGGGTVCDMVDTNIAMKL